MLRTYYTYKSEDMHKWWEEIDLKDMNQEQWESVCDRCGLCCLNKLKDQDSDDVFYTRVSCKLLDLEKCQCAMYSERKRIVKDCVQLTYKQLRNHAHKWLPNTCGYKRLFEGDKLPEWHHLNTGSTDQMHELGKTAKSYNPISEYEMGENDYLDDFIIKIEE